MWKPTIYSSFFFPFGIRNNTKGVSFSLPKMRMYAYARSTLLKNVGHI